MVTGPQNQETAVLLPDMAKLHKCSLRTAARIARKEGFIRRNQTRQAVEVAAHLDWGNRVDVAQEVRDIADVIEHHGASGVSDAVRNRVVRGFPLSLKVARS